MRKAPVNDEDWVLVPLVLQSEKRIGGSIRDLVLRLRGYQEAERNANARDWVHDLPLTCERGIVDVRMRICGSLRCPSEESWRTSIIIFNERVDGICHHVRAPDGRGGIARGWHRHEWNPVTRSCKQNRTEIRSFDPRGDMQQFVLLCCEQYGVKLEQEVASDKL